jgi:adenine-specific DNA-methyltransferase
MLYPRLKLARNLLSDIGAIFISIDDNEIDNLKKLCNEIFGEDNFVSCVSVEMSLTQGMKVGAAQNGKIVKNGEYILIYSKNERWKSKQVLYDGVNGYDTHFSIYLQENSDGTLEMKPIGEFLKNSWELKPFFDKYQLSLNFKSFQQLIEISEEFRDFIYEKLSNHLYQSMMASINLPTEVKEELSKGNVVKYEKYILHQVDSGKIRQLLPLSATLGGTDDYYRQFGRRRIRGDFWKGFYRDMMNVAKEGDTNFKNGKKPVRLIEQLLKWGSNFDSIILDFFSGSSTTAHSVIKFNSENKTNRKFIMVQLPEPTDEKSESYKAGYKTIAEIGKERIRRAGEKIKSESNNKGLDIGFEVFKLDSSNLTKWNPDYNNLEQTLIDTTNNLVPERTELDLVYEIMLKYGIDLTLSIEEYNINNKKLYSIGFGALLICLDNNITKEIAIPLIELKNKLSPETSRVVFKDNGFASDSDKTNIKETLKTNNIDEFITI